MRIKTILRQIWMKKDRSAENMIANEISSMGTGPVSANTEE